MEPSNWLISVRAFNHDDISLDALEFFEFLEFETLVWEDNTVH